MKKILMALCLIPVLMASCQKDDLAPTEELMEMPTDTTELLFSATFVDGPWGSVSGEAEIYKVGDSLEIKLANFNSTNGPDLHVFLSKNPMPNADIDLGMLKSTAGNQIYNLTYIPDFNEYQYVSIHCVKFNHLFGSAKFK